MKNSNGSFASSDLQHLGQVTSDLAGSQLFDVVGAGEVMQAQIRRYSLHAQRPTPTEEVWTALAVVGRTALTTSDITGTLSAYQAKNHAHARRKAHEGPSLPGVALLHP